MMIWTCIMHSDGVLVTGRVAIPGLESSNF
jgi:hypothetical protein